MVPTPMRLSRRVRTRPRVESSRMRPASPSATSTVSASIVCVCPRCTTTACHASSSGMSRATRQPSRKSAPHLAAAVASSKSSRARDTARPPGRRIAARLPPACRDMWCSACPPASSRERSIPIFSSTSSARLFRQQPHTLGRGNCAFSANTTCRPRAAHASAAVAPAGPAPMTSTSHRSGVARLMAMIPPARGLAHPAT